MAWVCGGTECRHCCHSSANHSSKPFKRLSTAGGHGNEREERRAAWAHRSGGGGSSTGRPSAPGSGLGPEKLPYRLRAVGHSLGGASLLVRVPKTTSDAAHGASRGCWAPSLLQSLHTYWMCRPEIASCDWQTID